MEKFYKQLLDCTLFEGIDEQRLPRVLECLGAHKREFEKNQTIRHPETEVTEVGIVVEGAVRLTKVDIDGNRIILRESGVGQTFGESLAFTGTKNSPIAIAAVERATIIFIPVGIFFTANPTDCQSYKQLAINMIKTLAERNMLLQIKNDILSQKTTREKLLMYFEYESKTAGSKSFKIHLNREELADFLCLNSSALSRELGKMRDEGILTFHKNRFTLKNTQ